MRVNIMRTAARTVTAGAVGVLGLGGAQASLAGPAPAVVNVPCSAAALAGDIAGAVSGETLNLVKFCTYELTAALAPISVNLTIQGDEDTVERSYRRGTPGFSVFVVTDGANVAFNQLNIRNGNSSGTGNQSPMDNSGFGGAIYNEDGNITVTGGTMRGNTANLDGGAIDNLGGMTVQGTVFQGNQADNGGAIATGFQALGSSDAFIHADEVNPTTVTGSSFAGNSAINGGAMYIEDSTAVLHCNFTGNTADAAGGGIDVVNGLKTIARGHAVRPSQLDDGSPVVTGSGFYQNQAEFGGGMSVDNAAAVSGTTFRLNRATDEGGGFYNDGDATLNGVTFAYDTARYGGGFFNDDIAALTHTTFTYNTARYGGGFYNDDEASIERSQIFRNTAAVDGGGIFNEGGSTITLTNTPVTENHPDNCGPIGTIAGCAG
jgi:predicted outer membrane repeat protein